MYNNILTIGSFTIYGYGLMIGIGLLVGLALSNMRAKARGLDTKIIDGIFFTAIICGFLGAKLFFIVIEMDDPFSDPMKMLSGSGFVVYGGIICGILACMIYCKVAKVHFLTYFDIIMPAVALIQGFGRLGCFLAGCCYGLPTNSIFGIAFHNSEIAPNNIKLIPTQLFSSAGDFLIAFILIIYAKKERTAGKVAALYMILYSVGRFGIEFFRGDLRGNVGVLSSSQFISLIVFCVGVVMYIFLKKRERAS
ncbi:MAG: prolipoprotein diacylglyceryl transferase [Deferribacteraceae bacterium]|jgi:phosphatidylglycerol:prolipoprotein diacylglycerol transferase|nr:prolipoprotein diacylglyceryl transferase [Deferribacteraceae bacterium]